jgi:hypothetical protein
MITEELRALYARVAVNREPRSTSKSRQTGALIEHPTQRAAAAALGISEQLLHRRRRYIEQAVEDVPRLQVATRGGVGGPPSARGREPHAGRADP